MSKTERDKLLSRIKTGLMEVFGARFRGLILFGSEARGTARPDSDIDMIVQREGFAA